MRIGNGERALGARGRATGNGRRKQEGGVTAIEGHDGNDGDLGRCEGATGRKGSSGGGDGKWVVGGNVTVDDIGRGRRGQRWQPVARGGACGAPIIVVCPTYNT